MTNYHGCWNMINNPPISDLDGKYTGKRYPLSVCLTGQIKKKEPSIVGMEITLSLREWGITPNDSIIQPSNISSWETHHSWSQKMVKDQYLTAYTFEIKWPSITSFFVCLRIHTGINSIRCRLTQIYILYFELIKKYSEKKTYADTILLPVTQKARVTHFLPLTETSTTNTK